MTKTTHNILFKITFFSVRHKAENATDYKAKTIFSSIGSEATDDRCTRLLQTPAFCFLQVQKNDFFLVLWYLVEEK